MTEMLHFDTEVIEIPFTVRDKQYTLREASAGAAAQWKNYGIKCTVLGPEGNPQRIEGIADLEAFLVHLCTVDDRGKRVPLQIINSWGNRVVKPLYQEALRISDLEEGPSARELLGVALREPDSPISIDGLRAWVETLSGTSHEARERYAPLAAWLRPLPEERVKNDLSGSVPSST